MVLEAWNNSQLSISINSYGVGRLTGCLHTGAAGFQLDADWAEEQMQEQWTRNSNLLTPPRAALPRGAVDPQF